MILDWSQKLVIGSSKQMKTSKLRSDCSLEVHISLPSPASFHAQRAAEKAQKAFLTWHGKFFSKTHDLSDLGAECVTIDPALGSVCSSVALISSYAVAPRYPGSWSAPTVAEAEEATKLARAMYDAVIVRLPDEVKL